MSAFLHISFVINLPNLLSDGKWQPKINLEKAISSAIKFNSAVFDGYLKDNTFEIIKDCEACPLG